MGKPDDVVTIVAEGQQQGGSAVVVDPSHSGAVKVQMEDGTTRNYLEHELTKVMPDVVEICKPELPKFTMPPSADEDVSTPRRGGRRGNARATLVVTPMAGRIPPPLPISAAK